MLMKIIAGIFIIACLSGCACLRQGRRLNRSIRQIEKNIVNAAYVSKIKLE